MSEEIVWIAKICDFSGALHVANAKVVQRSKKQVKIELLGGFQSSCFGYKKHHKPSEVYSTRKEAIEAAIDVAHKKRERLTKQADLLTDGITTACSALNEC